MSRLTCSVDEAAILLSMSAGQVRGLVARGDLIGVPSKQGGKTVVSLFSILRLLGAPDSVIDSWFEKASGFLEPPPPRAIDDYSRPRGRTRTRKRRK